LSLLSGRATITRYRLLGERKNWTLERLSKLISLQKVPALSIKRPIEVQYGWDIPAIETEITSGGHWDMSHCRLENDYVLRIRIDKKNVPASLIAELYRQELDSRGDDKLSKDQKDELLESLRYELLQQALPQIKHLDVLWQVERDQVLLFSAGTGDREIFTQLFTRTFSDILGLSLVQLSPPLMSLPPKDWDNPENNLIYNGLKRTLPTLYQNSHTH
tara:strand:- start:816 stop:1469 length:654 start_codon:yes stop_codon:yes gene_type:complete